MSTRTKRIMLRQGVIRSVATASDTLTITVVGKWNLIAVEAKYDGYPCLGALWYEPVERLGPWGSVSAVGLVSNPNFCNSSNILWHGKLPLQDNRKNKIIVGLADGETGAQLSLSILLEEK